MFKFGALSESMVTTLKPQLGANPERARSHNKQLVLRAIRHVGTAGRAEIARASGLSTQAVSNIISDLLREGLLVEQGVRSAGRGLPVQQYAIKPDGGYAFGVEVRPTAVFIALVDLVGTPLLTQRTPLVDAQKATILDTVSAQLDDALSKTHVPKALLMGAGIVMPGPFGDTGLTGADSELPGWNTGDPAESFANELDLPVFVENDANAAAMAERMNGVARGLDDFAYLYFGQGLGLGLVQNGQAVQGAFGNAGEIGHITVIVQDRPVELETATSRLSVQAYLAGQGVTVTDMDDLNSLYSSANRHLLVWLDQAAQALSSALSIIENLFDPQTVILGGAMPDDLLDHIIAHTVLPERSVANRPDRTHPRLMRGTSGRMTATLGAAALVLHQAFTPTIAEAR
ncbi:ROK family transcriptional regulator [Marivita sp. XM-24bin2]|uniref:ROK family transcriptional regulator n=2 Tax=unclassified Marivita TaxID=2632480 RepID=UPI0025BC7FF2|nr:ROK family transcriptional regulator [Marivita sp. XM-24bin2]